MASAGICATGDTIHGIMGKGAYIVYIREKEEKRNSMDGISIILPSYMEEENLIRVLPKLRKAVKMQSVGIIIC